MPANRLPAFQFYPGDWLKDPELRRSSKAARGALIDILCLAHECDFRGALWGSNTAWSREEISDGIGGSRDENLALIQKLIDNGPLKVWSKVSLKDLKTTRPDLLPSFPDGMIYNRRMLKDEIKRMAGKQAGIEGGGNPTLKPLKVSYKGKFKGKKGSSVEDEVEEENEVEIGAWFKNGKFKESWKNWEKVRKAKAGEWQYKRLERLSNGVIEVALDILRESIENGYKGIFDYKGNDNGKNNKPKHRELLDAGAERIHELAGQIRNRNPPPANAPISRTSPSNAGTDGIDD